MRARKIAAVIASILGFSNAAGWAFQLSRCLARRHRCRVAFAIAIVSGSTRPSSASVSIALPSNFQSLSAALTTKVPCALRAKKAPPSIGNDSISGTFSSIAHDTSRANFSRQMRSRKTSSCTTDNRARPVRHGISIISAMVAKPGTFETSGAPKLAVAECLICR